MEWVLDFEERNDGANGAMSIDAADLFPEDLARTTGNPVSSVEAKELIRSEFYE